MSTTFELLEHYESIQNAINEVGENEELQKNLIEAEEEIKKLLITKVDNIDVFIMGLNNKEATINAHIEVTKKELDRLKIRAKSVDNTRKYLMHNLLPAIIKEIGENNKLKTSIANYTAYPTMQVKEWILEELDKKYEKQEIVYKYDKIKAKKDAVELLKDGKEMNGCKLMEVWNTRRS